MESPRAQKFSARVSDIYPLNDNQSYLLVKLELVNPDRMEFKAGQYISMKVNESGERRSYSIVNTPDTNHGIELCVEIVPGGKGSEYVKKLKPGDVVEILGPLGKFVVEPEETADRKMLFVATGSGIAPISAMINDLLINKRETRPMRLHWGMRDEQHLFWFDNFERLAEEHPNFVFDPVLSKPSEGWNLCRGHIQDCIERDFAEEKMDGWEIYYCGGEKMMEDMSGIFVKMGTPKEHLHHEKFA